MIAELVSTSTISFVITAPNGGSKFLNRPNKCTNARVSKTQSRVTKHLKIILALVAALLIIMFYVIWKAKIIVISDAETMWKPLRRAACFDRYDARGLTFSLQLWSDKLVCGVDRRQRFAAYCASRRSEILIHCRGKLWAACACAVAVNHPQIGLSSDFISFDVQSVNETFNAIPLSVTVMCLRSC